MYILSEGEQAVIDSVLGETHADYSMEGFKDYFYRCKAAGARFPEGLKRSLLSFQSGNEYGFILLRNLPLDHPLPPTPREKESAGAALEVSSKLITAISSLLGFIYTFDHKVHLNYIDDIYPIEGDKAIQVSSNSMLLDWHVEDGVHPLKADFVALLCLRGDQNAHTLIAPVKMLEIPEEFESILREERFRIRTDSTFVQGAAPSSLRTAVLSGPRNDPEIVFDPPFMECVDHEAQVAFDHLHAAIQKHHISICLRSGDLLLFDNRRVAHARSPYDPRYNGRDRWLKRSLILESLSRAKPHMVHGGFLVKSRC